MLNLPHNPQFCQTDVSGSTFVNADCFDVFPFIEDKSIDAIICDLPYGTTQNKWDSETTEPAIFYTRCYAYVWRLFSTKLNLKTKQKK